MVCVVDQMHGIEIEEWPARIAEVAMWLMDHQMNQEVFQVFGKPLLRLPLTKSAKIVVANALRIDWNAVLPAKHCSYVMGNPPFVGKQFATPEQKAALIKGATDLLVDVLDKSPATTFVVIEEVEMENWGIGGELMADKYPDK